MNSGVVLWVENTDLAQAQRILDGVESDDSTGADLLASMSDIELGIVSGSPVNHDAADNQFNKGGNA